jgi:hypothetical protein
VLSRVTTPVGPGVFEVVLAASAGVEVVLVESAWGVLAASAGVKVVFVESEEVEVVGEAVLVPGVGVLTLAGATGPWGDAAPERWDTEGSVRVSSSSSCGRTQGGGTASRGAFLNARRRRLNTGGLLGESAKP